MHSSHVQRFKSRRSLVIGIVPSMKLDNLFLSNGSKPRKVVDTFNGKVTTTESGPSLWWTEHIESILEVGGEDIMDKNMM